MRLGPQNIKRKPSNAKKNSKKMMTRVGLRTETKS
jgi:hypothetical protein